MPGRFLSNAQRELLTHGPNQILKHDLIAYFTLTDRDLVQIAEHRKPHTQLGFALQLVLLRYLGFVPNDLQRAPGESIAFLARQLGIDPEQFKLYGNRPKTRIDHLLAALGHLGYRRANNQDLQQLQGWLVERALEHDKPTLLLEMACQHLKHQYIVRPGITTLERMVVTARSEAHQLSLQRMAELLTPEREAWLDLLLEPHKEMGRTQITWLRRHAIANTPDELLAALEKLVWLREYDIHTWNLTALNPNRQKFLARLTCKYSNQAIQRMGPERRYPMLIAFLKQTLVDITDEIIDLFDALLAGVHHRGKLKLQEHRQRVAAATEAKVRLFHQIGSLILSPQIDDVQLRTTIYQQVPPKVLEAAVSEADTLARPNGHLDFLDNYYNYVRHFAPRFLEVIRFFSNQDNDSLLQAVEVLRELNASGKRKLSGGEPLGFIGKRWHGFVFKDGEPNRHAYELCALSTLRDAFRSGDIYFEHSRRYADPESYLIPKAQWPDIRSAVCQELELSEQGKQRLHQRAETLQSLLPRLDHALNRKEGIRIEDGELIVPADEGKDLPKTTRDLAKQIRTCLPQVALTDVLIEVDRWTGFSKCFTHAGGLKSRSPDLLKHLYACLLAEGSNMNLMEMAHSADMDYDQLVWTNTWYLRDETLRAATTALVDFQYKQPLAQHWGGGTFSSSDGQRFPVRGKVRNASALPRYFGYGKGITFYSWTSDQFSQYGTKVVSSTVRDATYVLDEILDNETELTILEHTTDTAGYTDLVFALFDLLGMQFSPRIRDLGGQTLYRLIGDKTPYPNLDARLSGRVNLQRIQSRWDDLLRVAGSLKRGYVTASLLISKLQAYPRQNNLTRLLQEYGRLIKTIFILRYLEDETFRRRIGAQLSKGEQLHQLRKFLFFVRDGKVTKKHEETQTDQAACLNLMTNAVIVWNTVYMQAALEHLRENSYPVCETDLVHLSPARFAHINRYGKYRFDLEKAPQQKQLRPLRQTGDFIPTA